jgi:hypothetical protein
MGISAQFVRIERLMPLKANGCHRCSHFWFPEVGSRQKNDRLLFGKQQLLTYAILAIELHILHAHPLSLVYSTRSKKLTRRLQVQTVDAEAHDKSRSSQQRSHGYEERDKEYCFEEQKKPVRTYDHVLRKDCVEQAGYNHTDEPCHLWGCIFLSLI